MFTSLTGTNELDVKMSCIPLSVRLLRDRQRRSRGQAILTFEDWEVGESIRDQTVRNMPTLIRLSRSFSCDAKATRQDVPWPNSGCVS